VAERRRDTRQALIEAGWDALGELRWVDLFPSARSLSARVGVSTGSFFHHFRSIDHYAEVLARSSMERLQADVGVVAELLHRLARGTDGVGSVRAAAEADAVLDAAAALFARTDPELIPVDTLAAAAGVASSEIVARFGSMVGVATAVASRAVLALGVDDAAQPSDPVDHVEARLAALVEWTRSHPALAQVLLDARLRAARSSGPAAVPANPGQILVEPLQVLRQGGALRRPVDVGTLATTVADGAMLRVALQPTEPTERVTRETLDLALHGALEPESWARGS